MNTNHLTIAGPYTHENLSIFLLLGAIHLHACLFLFFSVLSLKNGNLPFS